VVRNPPPTDTWEQAGLHWPPVEAACRSVRLTVPDEVGVWTEPGDAKRRNYTSRSKTVNVMERASQDERGKGGAGKTKSALSRASGIGLIPW
jgi:hypothetical protein